jgi:geranylgeranyl diphosphate synthase type II
MAFDLNTYMTERRALIEAELGRLSAAPEAPVSEYLTVPDTLRKAMAYSLLAGGKRLRPILALAGCEAVGGDPAVVLPFACALEMIHTYSLIHDDLPAMDDDDFRRGRPTNHKVFGEGMAILTGDAMLTEAFVVASHCPAPAAVMLQVLRDLAIASGPAGMVGGQVIDVEATGKKVDLELLRRLHAKKTGALLSIAVCAGARLGGASDSRIAELRIFADALGLAFQIVDDVLDITADLQTLGKDPGSDRAAGKTTYVDLLGIDGARQRAEQVMTAGLAALDSLGAAGEPLRALGRYTLERSS